jgi:glucose-1-phosphate cytidylyltransferase
MKVLILAGGHGTRLSEETDVRPKPMVEIGGWPILWHIMKIYSQFGYNDFVILLGYKGYMIKEYFANYFLHQSNITVDLANNKTIIHNNSSEPWKITLLDTGSESMTGGRVKRAQPFVGQEPFMLTYGDGVSNVNIKELVAHHRSHGRLMTMTAVQPDGRFGTFEAAPGGEVKRFLEKPKGDGSWISGGFFVCEPQVFDYITDGDPTVLEKGPMEALARDQQLRIYEHSGFWKCMDTLRDKTELNEMWNEGRARWKTW